MHFRCFFGLFLAVVFLFMFVVFCLCLCFLLSFVRLLFFSLRACEAGSCVIL